MKLLLKWLAVSTITATPLLQVSACMDTNIADVWIITDGGNLFDAAFNQQGWEGIEQFSDTFNSNIATIRNINHKWDNHNLHAKYIMSKSNDISTLQNNYSLAAFAGAKTIVLCGIHHLAALTPEIQRKYKTLGINFILVDAGVSDPINTAGLTYLAEQSGFLAGLAGAIWLEANALKPNPMYDANNLQMSTFGGLPLVSILSYMVGFYWGCQYYDGYKTTDPNILTMVNNLIKAYDPSAPLKTVADLTDVKFFKSKNQFTMDFLPGTAGSKALNNYLINTQKVNLVLPVAGAETIDLVSAIKASPDNSNARIVGVDVDQSIQYSYAKDLFITSAKKGIHESIYSKLWSAFNLKISEEGVITANAHGQDDFNGVNPQPSLGGPKFTGMYSSPDVNKMSAIYDDVTGTHYWAMAGAVSDAFSKMSDFVNHGGASWDDAWANNIDSYKPDFSPS